MGIFMLAIAIMEFGFGVFVLKEAKSAIHEILGTLLIGFSVLTLTLLTLLIELTKIRNVLVKLPPSQDPALKWAYHGTENDLAAIRRAEDTMRAKNASPPPLRSAG